MVKPIAVLAVSLLLACGSSRHVTHLDPTEITDVSGKWNVTDARLVAEEMVSDCLTRPWLEKFHQAESREPVVVVWDIRNESNEHIDTEIIISYLEQDLTNSGRITFIAGGKAREIVRKELLGQQESSSDETAKRMAEETGADFVLLGAIRSIIDQHKGTKIITFQIKMELIHVENLEKAWIGVKDIKKAITQDKWAW